MKPLHDEARRIIAEASASDMPDAAAEARIWNTLSKRWDAPLPPTAAAAEEALGTARHTASWSGLGTKLVIGTAAFGILSAASWSALVAFDAKPGHPPPHGAPQEEVGLLDAALGSSGADGPALESSSSSTLLAETRLIAAAQQALRSDTPSRALALLEQHRVQFPRGELAQERDGARVLALCALGRAGDARLARRQFVQDWPGSPLVARVLSGCAARAPSSRSPHEPRIQAFGSDR